jgi:hypothetical protein
MPSDGEILIKAAEKQPQLPVWLTHLWQRRLDHKRLGLVLGAGVSYDAGIPMWEELVGRLATAANVPADRMKLHKDARIPETYLAEILFRKHSDEEKLNSESFNSKNKVHHINSSWKEKIRKCLYRDVDGKDFKEILKDHPYLKDLAKLVCESRFAVTFNFDDIVDEAVVTRVEELTKDRSDVAVPEIIYFPKVETRKNAPVIYHINGSLPRDELRRSSEKIILTEDAFADILLSPSSHEAEFVINQFSIRTFLLLGISLGDNSLKNLLRSSARRNPANHHFIVFHERDGAGRSIEERSDIFEVNLNVYNLISIFLTTSEIAAFIRILNEQDGAAFDRTLSKILKKEKTDRKYYLVGSVAAGKSSALDRLRCFTTYEEFGGRVPAAMYKNDKTITPEEQEIIDEFLFPQLISKNTNMYRAHSGIRVTDRACLDLFAFSQGEKTEILRKAILLKEWLGSVSGTPLQSGQIFFLRASEEVLEERLARRGTKRRERDQGITRFDTGTLLKQEEDLLRIYRMSPEETIDTTRVSLEETVKNIARTILLGPYEPFDFAARLDEIIAKGGEL